MLWEGRIINTVIFIITINIHMLTWDHMAGALTPESLTLAKSS